MEEAPHAPDAAQQRGKRIKPPSPSLGVAETRDTRGASSPSLSSRARPRPIGRLASLSLSRARARVLLPPLAKNSTQQSLTSTVSSSSSFSFSQRELQVPGFGIGVALFGVYMIAETASKAVGGTKPQKGHH